MPILVTYTNLYYAHSDRNFYVLFILTGEPTFQANVFPRLRDVVNYITPYTTWLLTVAPERSAYIDLSKVTAVTLTFHGSAKDAFGASKLSNGLLPKDIRNGEGFQRIPYIATRLAVIFYCNICAFFIRIATRFGEEILYW